MPLKAPGITLTAIGSGRRITLNQIDSPAVLLFHGRNTAEASKSVNGPLRDRYPEASALLIASIMDLHIAPKLLRGMVESFIKDAYEEACQELPAKWPARDYLLLLPDWDGKITKAFGFSDTDKTAGVAVLNANAELVGIYQGKDLVAQTLALLDKIS